MAVEAEPDGHVLTRYSGSDWALRTDRCVAEFAVRFAGVTVVRGWVPALSGRFTPGASAGLELWLDAKQSATDPKPLAGRIRSLLGAGRTPEIGFESTYCATAGTDRLVVVGELEVAGRKTILALQARVVSAGERGVIVHGESYLPLAEVLPGRKQVKGGWRRQPGSLRLTLAAEFTAEQATAGVEEAAGRTVEGEEAA
ncbi:YceI family protein [Flindersiella endophytica]